MLRFLTAGESHGPALVVVIDGVPAGVPLSASDINPDLARRQLGYGRGRRMQIEQDRVEILSGVRQGDTLGSPIALLIHNRDWVNWQYTMRVEAEADDSLPGARRAPVTRPRPGHADLSGGLKYERHDLRDILERASARETAARVAGGAVARAILRHVGITVTSHVFQIGVAQLPTSIDVTYNQAAQLAADDDVRCVDGEVAAAMRAEVDRAKAAGDTVGGAFEVIAHGVPAGLGSHVQWDRKLDGLLAQALMSIHAIKAVGIGVGPAVGHLPGSQVHDEIVRGADTGAQGVFVRPTNRAGGLEGGITNGEDVRASAWMKPIATLMTPLRSVDMGTLEPSDAAIERSDTCAVPAAAVVGEAMVAWVLAGALLEKFGGDSLRALQTAVEDWRTHVRTRLTPGAPSA